MTTNKWCFLISVFLVIGAGACTSARELVEYGSYDEAISVAIQKLAGKKKKKAELVAALEEAFEKATERDMREADRLKSAGRPEYWEKIFDIYRRIDQRQKRIEPLLPLIDKNGIQAEFLFVRIADLEREAREKAAGYSYARAKAMLEKAELETDRLTARQAYHELEKIDRYFRDYHDRDELMRRAKAMGTSHVLITIRNEAGVVLPRDFEDEIKRISVQDLNKNWKVFHLAGHSDIDVDYTVEFNITHLEVGPSVVKEREIEETREIEDGFDYVLDERGNVKKDSLGNDIKIPRKVVVRAWVLEHCQQKSAHVAGRIDFIDNRTRHLLDSKPLAADAFFEHFASTFRGDQRALSPEGKRWLGRTPVPFPNDLTMLFDVVEQIKPALKSRIANSRVLI